jgi:hypothetical protein
MANNQSTENYDNTHMIDLVRKTILSFCLEFVETPYLCYTEHGQHALFYNQLFQAIPKEMRYLEWKGQKVCVVQKEYPTSGKLGKPQRQHWDIAVLSSPPASVIEGPGAFDYLMLDAVIEFGMNEAKEHLVDDIERLSHPDANLVQGFAVHLYRLSEPGYRLSGRDWSPKSKQLLTAKDIRWLSIDKPVEIYLAIYDSTHTHSSGIWKILDGQVSRISFIT